MQVYLTTLEAVKAETAVVGEKLGIQPTALAGVSNFFGKFRIKRLMAPA